MEMEGLIMKPTKEEVITIYVTPKALRIIADDLENRMEKATVGDVVPGHAFYGDGLKVMLLADQGAWHAHTAGGSWK